MKRNLLLITLLFSSLLLLAFRNLVPADAPFVELLKQKLATYQEQLPDEKIYVQLDKSFYKPGEDIWFKVYALNGSDHTATRVSEIVHVELINPRGAVEKEMPLLIRNGGGKGDFKLEETAPGGLYTIRAYTRWMKNLGESTYFKKEIQVQKVIMPRVLLKLDFEKEAYGPADPVEAKLEVRNLKNEPVARQNLTFQVQLNGKDFLSSTAETDKEGKATITFALPNSLASPDGLLNISIKYNGQTESISRSVPIVLNKIDLQFFPEGGDLVQQVRSKVAFKAVNEFGKPADVEGEVLDVNGKVVQRFNSYHQGMGAFTFLPETRSGYSARITKPRGVKDIFTLPIARAEGYVLAVDPGQQNQLPVRFHAPAPGEVYVVAQVRGKIYFSEKISAKAGQNNLNIPLHDFPVGIAQVTLFNPSREPVCERLAFVNAGRKLTIKITSDKQQYKPREKVALGIKTTDETGKPVPANVSVSVVDDKIISFADDKQNNILSGILVTSELKGKVEEPAFYFKKDEPKAPLALEYLLMTQGWRRFRWQEVIAGNPTVTYRPEKVSTYEGKIVRADDGKPVVGKVTLLELGNKKRVAQLKTRPDGTFVFRQVDASVPVQVLAYPVANKKAPIKIEISGQQEAVARNTSNLYKSKKAEIPAGQEVIVEDVEIVANNAVPAEGVANLTQFKGSTQNISLKEDAKSLNEVIVIGYGAQEKRNLTGAVSTISAMELTNIPRLSTEQLLQGRVAGVVVNNAGGTPGSVTNVRIRGSSSIANPYPLLVVDGVIFGGSYVGTADLSFLSPDNIQHIDIFRSPEASAIYGSLAANGVISITTKRPANFYNSGNNRSTYSSFFLEARSFAAAREFYAPVYTHTDTVKTRTDFRSTIYWNPEVKTNEQGEASITFYNSDELTAFRATVEGFGNNGLIGREEYVYSTQLPFNLDAKVPAYFTFGDVVHLPVILKNNTTATITGGLKVVLPQSLKRISPVDSLVSINPQEVKTVYVSCVVRSVPGPATVKITFSGNQYRDAFTQEIEVQPKGFPVVASFSGKDLDKAFSFTINDPLPGSVTGEFKAYPDIIGDLMAGMESIFREPHGCFEQTSSSTYPNILALQYLKETRQVNPEIEKKALQYIKNGYTKLVAFETKQNGFEWYGATPPHEGLSAFGLMEFLEMEKVYSGVNPALIKRTKEWLLSRRTGDGNFKQNRGLYGFSAATREVNNAYLVYALSEAGIADIGPEFNLAGKEALQSKDAYRLALLANAAFNLKNQEKANAYLHELVNQVQGKGLGKLAAQQSIVVAYGNTLQVETAALIALALLKSPEPASGPISAIIQYLISSRSYGGFGSTQATILALKALTTYSKFSQRTSNSGTLALYRNGQLLHAQQYQKGHRGEIAFASLGSANQSGLQQYRVAFTNTPEALPYSVNLSWTSLTPNTSKQCKVDVETTLAKRKVPVGETVRLSTTLTNKDNSGVPMTVALVGIPAGLSPQPWQLKEIQEKKLVDFYEVRQNYVVFYYRELGPKAVHTIHLDLKAEIPGAYQAGASSAYLYYTNEHKDWEAGENVEVMK